MKLPFLKELVAEKRKSRPYQYWKPRHGRLGALCFRKMIAIGLAVDGISVLHGVGPEFRIRVRESLLLDYIRPFLRAPQVPLRCWRIYSSCSCVVANQVSSKLRLSIENGSRNQLSAGIPNIISNCLS